MKNKKESNFHKEWPIIKNKTNTQEWNLESVNHTFILFLYVLQFTSKSNNDKLENIERKVLNFRDRKRVREWKKKTIIIIIIEYYYYNYIII